MAGRASTAGCCVDGWLVLCARRHVKALDPARLRLCEDVGRQGLVQLEGLHRDFAEPSIFKSSASPDHDAELRIDLNLVASRSRPKAPEIASSV